MLQTRRPADPQTRRNFENLVVWQEARKLVVDIYKLTMVWKDYGLRDQIRRAVVSIVSNIAEGYERGSKVEFCRFLVIARVSAGEVKAQLYVARDLNYITEAEFEEQFDRVDHVIRMLAKLIASNRG